MCPWTPLNGSEMSSSATTGLLMVVEASVVEEWGQSCVPRLTAGPPSTEMILIIEVEAVKWPGKSGYNNNYGLHNRTNNLIFVLHHIAIVPLLHYYFFDQKSQSIFHANQFQPSEETQTIIVTL